MGTNENKTMKGETMNAKYPTNNLTQYPSGVWGFCGTVDADLVYAQADGTKATDAQLETAAKRGPRLAGLVSRTWETREAALVSLADCEG